MQVTVEDPDLVETHELGDRARVNLGKEFAGKKVKIVVEVIGEQEQNDKLDNY